MNQVGVIAHRLAHEPNFRQDLEQSLSTSAAETLTCEEQAALVALRGHLTQATKGFRRILQEIRGPYCGW